MAVLVTRPAELGIDLVDKLNKSSIAAIHFPFFSIEPDENLNQLPLKLAQLKAGDYVVAVSKYAVKYAEQTLNAIGAKWRDDLSYFAVGQGTAECFCVASQQAITYPFAQQNSEGLLALSAMSPSQLANKKLLLLRGNEGRELFPEQVQQRNAQLDIVCCYQRCAIEYDAVEQTSIWKRAGLDRILVTSADIFHSLLKFVPIVDHGWLKSCTLITISERIAQLARQQGWTQIVVAQRPDNITLCATMMNMVK